MAAIERHRQYGCAEQHPERAVVASAPGERSPERRSIAIALGRSLQV